MIEARFEEMLTLADGTDEAEGKLAYQIFEWHCARIDGWVMWYDFGYELI